MTAPTKFCVDCRHHVLQVENVREGFFRRRERTVTSHRCSKTFADPVNLVTGEQRICHPNFECSTARALKAVCGEAGTLWEAKP